MANQTKESNVKPLKKKGLPPISLRNGDEENLPRPVKRKPKKKPPDENTPPNEMSSQRVDLEEEEKPAPRRRRKRSPSQDKDAQVETKPAPRKKKKPKPQTTAEDGNQNANTQEKEAQGSKTSLISKEGETPRKKSGKKKKKVKKEVTEDEYGESPWAEDLRNLAEDIITGEGREEDEQDDHDTKVDEEEVGTEKMGDSKKGPITFLTAPVLRSQPLDKIFIETSSKFKGQNKTALARQIQEETSRAPEISPVEIPRATTIDFAVNSHKIFRVFSLFLHGLTAGLLLWQMIIVFVLSSSAFSDADFLEHYYRVSMPLQASLYFLLALGAVSACDRFDVANLTRRFLLRALTMQNGAVAIVFCLIALILSLVMVRYDDKMYLHKEIPDLFSDSSELSDDIKTFRSLNAARSVMVMLCWFVLSITPTADRLEKNLRSGETGLGVHLEMDKVSAA